MVVAGLALGLAAAGAVAAGGFAPGILPTGRAGEAGRLGLTVMRAVSLGGADLTMAVPDLVLGAGGVAGDEEAGFSGAFPGGGGVTSVVAGAGGGVTTVVAAAVDEGVAGTTGLTGLSGAIAPGVIGLIGLTGRTAAAGGLAPGRIGAGGMPGFAGAPLMGAGRTGGGGAALGVMAAGIVAGGGGSMACVLRGGATVDDCDAVAGSGVGGVFIGDVIEVVAGETRGGGMTMLDFFLSVMASTTDSVTAAAAMAAAGTTVAGRKGVGAGGAFSAFLGSGAGMAAVLLVGG